MLKLLGTIFVGLLVIFGGFVIFVLSIDDGSTELGSYNMPVLRTRLASARNALDGTGEFTVEDCVSLGELAREHDKTADYFRSCTDSNVNLMYLSTPDTSNEKVLVLSDETYSATFVTDNDFNYLMRYTFIPERSAGFNRYGGRR